MIPVKERFSATEIAALALRGLAATKQGVQFFADQLKWPAHAA